MSDMVTCVIWGWKKAGLVMSFCQIMSFAHFVVVEAIITACIEGKFWMPVTMWIWCLMSGNA